MVAPVQSMFKKLAISFPPDREGHLSPERAAVLLQRSHTFADQRGFEWVVADKPVDGSIFAFQLSSMEQLPEDGFGWMDDETVTTAYVNDKEMEIYIRNLGFGFGDTITSMTRRRYRLSNSTLQIMHYVRAADAAHQLPVYPQLIRVAPRDPAALQSLASPAGAPPPSSQGYGHGPLGPRYADTPSAKHAPPRKRNRAKQAAPVRPVDDEYEISGDELDDAVERLVALERYKRNHEYMDMILSPHNVANIIPSPLLPDDDPEKIEARRRELARLESEMSETAEAKRRELDDFKSSMGRLSGEIQQIKHARFS
ncbi:uncharacterized protein EV422DRAFT_532597 [Fimicolochytrium jonesii]|uniref:uncharacterized protein n=1 Tax=Fimicolochytrium jonesii TaxID=1396493 RepID=UPI0022FED0CD|nr:uncharacterized protein EV422DRAFT_532597 [Fimicolochytrium jonesii]KAI8819870.1 hypothetical protein EV422DRAFT_532597 [Fimicolochytrium jonesii]